MYIKLGDEFIANSNTDSVTVGMRATKPILYCSNTSTVIKGKKYARNFPNQNGLSLEFTIVVNRIFKNYSEAENFTINHILEISAYTEGDLKYENSLGNLYGFENAVLDEVEVLNEIGISTEIQYIFTCGSPLNKFPYCIKLNNNQILGFNNKILTLTI